MSATTAKKTRRCFLDDWYDLYHSMRDDEEERAASIIQHIAAQHPGELPRRGNL